MNQIPFDLAEDMSGNIRLNGSATPLGEEEIKAIFDPLEEKIKSVFKKRWEVIKEEVGLLEEVLDRSDRLIMEKAVNICIRFSKRERMAWQQEYSDRRGIVVIDNFKTIAEGDREILTGWQLILWEDMAFSIQDRLGSRDPKTGFGEWEIVKTGEIPYEEAIEIAGIGNIIRRLRYDDKGAGKESA